MKLFVFILILTFVLILASMVIAVHYSGDGSYNVTAGDVITASNGWKIEVLGPEEVMQGVSVLAFNLFDESQNKLNGPFDGHYILYFEDSGMYNKANGEPFELSLNLTNKNGTPQLTVRSFNVTKKTFYGEGTFQVSTGDKLILGTYEYDFVEVQIPIQGTSSVSISSSSFGTTTLIEGQSFKQLERDRGKYTYEIELNNITLDTSNVPVASISVRSIDENWQPENTQVPDNQEKEFSYNSSNFFRYASEPSTLALNQRQKILDDSAEVELKNVSVSQTRFEGEKNFALIDFYDSNGNPLPLIESIAGNGSKSYVNEIDLSEGEVSSNILDMGFTFIIDSINLPNSSAIVKASKSITLNLLPGWNLISVPLLNSTSENGVDIVENSCGSIDSLVIWEYDTTTQSYSKANSLKADKGYWIKVSDQCHITFGGNPINISGESLKAGWNMINGPTRQKRISDIEGNCNITSGPWSYFKTSRIYEKDEILSQSMGYFIKVSDDCNLS